MYVRYAPQVKAFLRRSVGDISEQDVDDITQDIFVTLWKRRDTLEEIADMSAYLFRMSRNAALNLLRHKSVVEKCSGPVEDDALNVTVRDVSSIIEEKEALRRVLMTLDGLDEYQKLIFLMHRQDGMTYQQIADVLSISPRTVQYHIGQVLATLRRYRT